MNTSNRNFQDSYVSSLRLHVTKYLTILESILGPRDPRFVFGTIGKSDERPHTYFPDGFHFRGKCRVNICISSWPWDHRSPDQGPWQVAHECLHLLDPIELGTANVLEEGLATWFQNEPSYHNELVRSYIARNERLSPDYMEAEELVRNCMPDILIATKSLRAAGVRICDIKPELLDPLLSNIEPKAIERLCARFRDRFRNANN